MGDASDFCDHAPRFGHARAHHVVRSPRARASPVHRPSTSRLCDVRRYTPRRGPRAGGREPEGWRRQDHHDAHASATRSPRAAQRVLLVDLDPQACLTYSVGLDPESFRRRSTTCSRPQQGRRRARRRGRVSRAARGHRPRRLRGAPRRSRRSGARGRPRARAVKDDYDIVLVDCPPSLGILTINGLTAADFVLIPLQCETLSHRGVGQLLETVADVRAYTQPDLSVLGAVATMFDSRTPPRPRGARRRRGALRPAGARADDPAHRALRGGTGDRAVDPRPRAQLPRGAVAYRELASTVLTMLAP